MKQIILIAMATASILLAGCESDSDNSSKCSVDEVNSDCSNGRISKCIDGKWETTDCEGNASCKADGTCGECADGDKKNDCHEGIVSKCVFGIYQDSECEGGASCKADGTCGECTNGDTTQCTNDADKVGNAKVCRDGQWSETKEFCTDFSSCSTTDQCFQCIKQCNYDWPCPEKCTDSSCESNCAKNEACIQRCGECEFKCGICKNDTNKNCIEDAQGVASAEICINGTWREESCSYLRTIQVSCLKTCPDESFNCQEADKVSHCGQCKNTKTNEYICITPTSPVYGEPGLFGEYTQRCQCIDGYLDNFETCPSVCNQENCD